VAQHFIKKILNSVRKRTGKYKFKMLGRQSFCRYFATLSSLNANKNATLLGSASNESKVQIQPQLSQQLRFKSSHTLKIGENRQISYRLMPGQSQPTIVMVPGFHSYAHMNGMTAKSLLR
jgi:hypothetical protein